MSARPNCDVVVIGGGLIGCSIAWRLAQRKVRVIIVERDFPGRAASWAAAGMLSPIGESHHPEFEALATRSLAMYGAFVDELRTAGTSIIEFGTPGKLDVTHGANVWYAHDGFVDNRALSEAAEIAATSAGAQLRVQSSVIAMHVDDAGVHMLKLSSGEAISCNTVVVAAGAWSTKLPGLPTALPVFPVLGQMYAAQHDGSLKHLMQSKHCYLIPRSGGRVLVGATVENVGFDLPSGGEALKKLREHAIELLPGLGKAMILESWFGYRPGTPDELPILGRDPTDPGVVYATGHYRNGILLAPVTAELIADVIEGKDTPDLQGFGIERFDA